MLAEANRHNTGEPALKAIFIVQGEVQQIGSICETEQRQPSMIFLSRLCCESSVQPCCDIAYSYVCLGVWVINVDIHLYAVGTSALKLFSKHDKGTMPSATELRKNHKASKRVPSIAHLKPILRDATS